MDKQQLASTVNKVLDEMRQRPIPIGISSRHIHLAAADYARLFPAQPIQPKKALLQPGQYAAEQTVTLVGPKGRLNNVRLLGPLRQTSQVEISRTDARILGIAAPLRMSGNLQGTPGIRLISPFAELELSGGTIVAQRHIHMSPLDALILRVSHGDSVAVAIEGSDRRLIFDNVAVRVAPDMRLEMHIDTDEAMNHAMLQRIVEEVAARLRRRALSTATLSVAQLGEADIRSLLCQHASLRIVQVDLPLLEQLAGQRALAAAGCALHEAMAWGVRVQLTLLPAQLPALAVKKLARLPLTFSDPLGQPVRLHAASVLTYADVARFSGGYLVLRRRPIITALAREAAVARHVQLIKQE